MKNKKVWMNVLIFLVVFGLTVYGVFHGEDMGLLIEEIRKCNAVWLIPAVVCVFIFISGEATIIWDMLRCCGRSIRFPLCFLISSVGFFFSCVTPSATGGQPMQIYFMKKEEIPIAVSTVLLMIVTIVYKFVLVVIGLMIALFAGGFVDRYMGNVLFVFYLGLILNVACVAGMIVLVFHPSAARRILVWGLRLLERMHILKHKEGRLDRLEKSMDSYQETASFVRTHTALMIRIVILTFIQRSAMFAVTCFVYKAFGLSGTGWFSVLILQAVIPISVDMLPLPGGMGISESLFLKLFDTVFGDMLMPGMILSRGLGYYSELLISAFFTMVAVFVFDYRQRHRMYRVRKSSDN